MAIDKTVDIIGALAEDIQARIQDIPEVVNKGLHIYSSDQIAATQQRMSLPAVVFHYVGMQKAEKRHDVVFFVYLIAKTKSITNTKNSPVISDTTPILQELRKSLACSKSPTGSHWVLDSEIPDMITADKIVYRQRWSTSYHISN